MLQSEIYVNVKVWLSWDCGCCLYTQQWWGCHNLRAIDFYHVEFYM